MRGAWVLLLDLFIFIFELGLCGLQIFEKRDILHRRPNGSLKVIIEFQLNKVSKQTSETYEQGLITLWLEGSAPIKVSVNGSETCSRVQDFVKK